MITVTEAESVITWDFDVIDGDVMFTCLRHKRPRELSEGNLTGCLGETMSSRFSGVRPGVDAVVVEKPISCSHGESVQVCIERKTYFCGWGFFSNSEVLQTSKKASETELVKIVRTWFVI